MSLEVPKHSTVLILAGPCKQMTAQQIQDGSCCPIESFHQTLDYSIWKNYGVFIFGPGKKNSAVGISIFQPFNLKVFFNTWKLGKCQYKVVLVAEMQLGP